MKIIENKRYILIKEGDLILYFKKRKGVMHIMAHDRGYGADYSEDFLWIDKDFVDIRLLTRESENYCHVILKEPNGKGCIIELLSPKIVYDNFMFNNFKAVAKRRNDVVVSFLDKQAKSFSIMSLLEKEFVFGPCQYANIEECRYGVVIDKKIAVDNDGFVTDLSEYECVNEYMGIYYNEETDKYLLELDREGRVFWEPKKDGKDDDILVVEFDDCICRFNREEERIDWEEIYDDVPMDYYHRVLYQRELDEDANIAYEGHSRLELGLD